MKSIKKQPKDKMLTRFEEEKNIREAKRKEEIAFEKGQSLYYAQLMSRYCG